YAKALNNRGDALRALDRFEEALASYDRALAIAPDFVEALLHRGVTLRALGRFAEALACYDRMLATRPNFAEGYYNRGNVLDALCGDERAIPLRPALAEAFFSSGNMLRSLGRPAEALAKFDAALILQPHNAKFQFNRDLLHLETCKWDHAEKFLKQMRDLVIAGEFGLQPFT